MPTYVLTKGVHFPFNLGEAVIVRNIIKSLECVEKGHLDVISLVDPSRYHSKLDSTIKYFLSSGNLYLDTYRIVDSLRMSLSTENSSPKIIHISCLSHSVVLLLIKRYALSKKVRLVPHFYILDHASVKKYREFIVKVGMIFQTKLADAAIASSPLIADWLSAFGFKNVTYIPPPIDTTKFRNITDHQAIGKLLSELNLRIKDGSFVLLYIGNIPPLRFPTVHILKVIERFCRIGIVIDLIILTPNFEYNRKYSREIITMANNLEISNNVHVRVVDLDEHKKVLAYNFCDVFLFPALAPTAVDPPLTILEAMACGKVVLASPIQSIPYFITHNQNGLLVNFRLENKIFEILNYLINNKAVLEDLSRHARKSIERECGIDKTNERFLNLYKTFTN